MKLYSSVWFFVDDKIRIDLDCLVCDSDIDTHINDATAFAVIAMASMPKVGGRIDDELPSEIFHVGTRVL